MSLLVRVFHHSHGSHIRTSTVASGASPLSRLGDHHRERLHWRETVLKGCFNTVATNDSRCFRDDMEKSWCKEKSLVAQKMYRAWKRMWMLGEETKQRSGHRHRHLVI